MIADQFAEVQIFLPFPANLTALDSRLQNITEKIERLTAIENHWCMFFPNDTIADAKTETWLLEKVKAEHDAAKAELVDVKLNIAKLMRNSGTSSEPSNTREKRITPMLTVGATAALFGLGFGIGTTIECGLKGIFGACPDLAEENKVNIKKSIQKINNLSNAIIEVETNTNNKMFLVTSTLKQIMDRQEHFEAAQETNWRTLDEQLEIIQNYTHRSTECMLSIYMRVKILHQSMAIDNALQTILTSLTQYRAALALYRTTVHASFAVAVNNLIPLPLVPKEHLTEILEAVQQQQQTLNTRLQLAIPPAEILTYYESRILTAIRTNELGLLMVIAVPLAKNPIVMTVYQAHTIPMPTENSTTAIEWKTEAKYIAVAETRNEIALLTDEQLKYCLGSQSMSICYHSFSTDTSRHTCLATLFFGETVDALQACEVRNVQLPQREEATNLGNGQWLLTSANPNFIMKEISLNETNPVELRRHAGCSSCLISLPCGSYIEGPHVRLRPDMITCATETPFRINSTLTSELHSLFKLLPEIEHLPHFPDLTHARTELLAKVQGTLLDLPEWKPMAFSDIEEIAKPIIHNLTRLDYERTTPENQLRWTHITMMVGSASAIVVCILCICHCRKPKRNWQIIRRPEDDPRSPYESVTGGSPSPVALERIRPQLRPQFPPPPPPAKTKQPAELKVCVPLCVEVKPRTPIRKFVKTNGLLKHAEKINQDDTDVSEHTSTNVSENPKNDMHLWQVVKNRLGDRFPPQWNEESWKEYFVEQDEIYISSKHIQEKQYIERVRKAKENGESTPSPVRDMRQSTSKDVLPPLPDDQLKMWTILRDELGERFPKAWNHGKWQEFMRQQDVKYGVNLINDMDEPDDSPNPEQYLYRSLPAGPLSITPPQFKTAWDEDTWNKENQDPRTTDKLNEYLRKNQKFCEAHAHGDYDKFFELPHIKWIDTTVRMQDEVYAEQTEKEMREAKTSAEIRRKGNSTKQLKLTNSSHPTEDTDSDRRRKTPVKSPQQTN